MNDPDLAPSSVSRLRASISGVERLVLAVEPTKWHARTACEEMDVLGVVEHMVAGLEQFADVGLGKPLDPTLLPLVSAEDAARAYQGAGQRMVAVWSEPGAVDRTYSMPWGDVPGAALVNFMSIEQIAHGWDLARATTQQSPFDDKLVEIALGLAHRYDDDSIRVPGMFAPAVAVPDEAPVFDRLAAFLGRHP